MELAPKLTGLSVPRLERITEHLERSYIGPGKIAGCQVAVARHGHLAYFRSLGSMDLARGKPMADDALFRIYSMTKPITAVALMTLYERGYFQLNDAVSRFFPSWKDQRVWKSGRGDDMVTEAPVRPVSMRDMLGHTGGLTYGAQLESLGVPDPHPGVNEVYARLGVRRGRGETLSQFMEKLAGVPLLYQPGRALDVFALHRRLRRPRGEDQRPAL
jgi:CubicO group peptidase (beta-lactamase class C family)